MAKGGGIVARIWTDNNRTVKQNKYQKSFVSMILLFLNLFEGSIIIIIIIISSSYSMP